MTVDEAATIAANQIQARIPEDVAAVLRGMVERVDENDV